MDTALKKYQETRATLRSGNVTAIKAQKVPSRVSLYIDGTFAFGVAVSILTNNLVTIGQHLNVEELHRLLDADFVQKARHVAFSYLSFKARTSSELVDRLNRYSGNADFVTDIVAECRKLHLVDDESYATEFVESRHRSKGHGPSRLRSDLVKKGVARDTIESALSVLDSNKMEERAEDLLRRKWRSYVKLESLQKRRNRAISFLLRNGYNYGVAREAFDRVENDSADHA